MAPHDSRRDGGDAPRPVRSRRLGDFELLDEIGRGGMGIVYRARQLSLDRRVALKTLPSFAGMEPASVLRFRREAEAAARLAHPGIVPVYGVGEVDGIHYYAMELVEGPSLAELIERLRSRVPGRLLGSLAEETGIEHRYPGLKDPPGGPTQGARYARSCAALIADVANALAAAHAGMIIHRDLKPSNVMIHGAGRPVLLDFGLARDAMSASLTRTGDTVGTPSYMAPEQASGSKDVDARADIYGLGATLYELLTLRPPFSGGHAGEIMRKILDEDPVPVRKLNPRVPVELQTIVHTCLAKAPDGRYPAAEALELDLRALLAGRKVAAQSPLRSARAARFVRRNRRAAFAGAGALVVALAIAATAGVLADRRAEVSGIAALAQARAALLERGDVLEAEECIGRARALLGDPERIGRARRELAVEAFTRLYPRGEFAVLAQFFGALSADDRAQLRAYTLRVDGQGHLALRIAPPESTTGAAVALRPATLTAKWLPLPEDGALPVGDYLLRVERTGSSSFVRHVQVSRDATTEVAVWLRPQSDVPDGMVEVVDPVDGRSFAVSRTELSRADYRRFLEEIDDPVLRAELTPTDWNDAGALDQPVRGLSFRAARAVAARFDMHLLSEREYRLAATGGLPLAYPWGNQFDPRRVAADPDELDAPDPVHGLLEGASPLGVLHLLGNVDEFLSPGADGAPLLAGGHYQSRPEALVLDSQALIRRLASVDLEDGHAGTRLARFLPGPDDVAGAERARALRQEILDRGSHALFHDWTLDERGRLQYRLTIHGVHASTDAVVRLPLVTAGFLQLGTAAVSDGHGAPLRASQVSEPHREASVLEVHANGTRGRGYTTIVATELLPTDGLSGEGDAYVLRLPLKADRLPVVHEVELPAGSAVDDAEPRPALRFRSGGRTRLVWHLPPDEHGGRTIPAVVRFRKDGSFTAEWPSRAAAEGFCATFFAALHSGRRDALRELVHPTYLQWPSGLDYARLQTAWTADQQLIQLDDPRLLDFTAVGPVLTIDLLTDWRTFDDVAVKGWPLRLQAVRDGGAIRALRLMPKGRPDLGSCESDGTYVHPGLKVRLATAPSPIHRTREELTDMQVKITDESGADAWVQVLGLRATTGQTADELRVWLTAGASALRRGEPVLDPQPDPVGPEGQQIRRDTSHWMFGDERSGFGRERWTFITRGLRHFLVKAVAMGGTRAEARQCFERHRAWFDRIAAAVVIE